MLQNAPTVVAILPKLEGKRFVLWVGNIEFDESNDFYEAVNKAHALIKELPERIKSVIVADTEDFNKEYKIVRI